MAIVGAGPAGLTSAADLARMGHTVTIFEALHKPGGVLTYGIPAFRLPRNILGAEVQYVRALGVEIQYDCVIGRTATIDELMAETATRPSSWAPAPACPVPQHPGREPERRLLRQRVPDPRQPDARLRVSASTTRRSSVGKRVGVVGAGNVAMDASRTALRLGAEKVYIIYRRSRAEMPARAEEIHHAEEEGIEFQLLTNPVRVIDDGKGRVTGIECVEMELGEPDASGRRRPVEKEGLQLRHRRWTC